MFKIEELSGSLIKSGRFKDAITAFVVELAAADNAGLVTAVEHMNLQKEFCNLLLVPDAKAAASLGDKMLALRLRVISRLSLPKEEFDENVKKSREA
jgi:hypothetical protein